MQIINLMDQPLSIIHVKKNSNLRGAMKFISVMHDTCCTSSQSVRYPPLLYPSESFFVHLLNSFTVPIMEGLCIMQEEFHWILMKSQLFLVIICRNRNHSLAEAINKMLISCQWLIWSVDLCWLSISYNHILMSLAVTWRYFSECSALILCHLWNKHYRPIKPCIIWTGYMDRASFITIIQQNSYVWRLWLLTPVASE